ncbi:DinB family protein [Arthrobacter tecti]
MNDEVNPEPPIAGDETATLLGFLERQRATFAWKTSRLDETALQATFGPSSMTLGGLLKHLARFEDDMSTEWLHGRSQLPPWNVIDWGADPDWDWNSANQDAPAELYERWRDAVSRCRALLADALNDGGLGRQRFIPSKPDIELPSLRYILLNMIEEYARHNGHADLIRESVDGLVGQDPPESSQEH